MADGLGGMFGSMGVKLSSLTSGSFIGIIIAIVIGTIVLFFCGFGLYWFFWKRKNYNIKIEFKVPRNIREVKQKDGSIRVYGTLNKEWGKGFYDAKVGVVMIKRKGKKPVPMKPFDVKRYLSSGNILTVIQVGIEDYRPVLDDSYMEVVDADTGEDAALIRAKIDTTEGKSWRNSYERERKNAYTLSSWLKEHGQMLAIGLVIMMVLVGFGVLWTRLPKICG